MLTGSPPDVEHDSQCEQMLVKPPVRVVGSMELGSKLWSCSDLEKGVQDMSSTPEHEISLRQRIQETSSCL